MHHWKFSEMAALFIEAQLAHHCRNAPGYEAHTLCIYRGELIPPGGEFVLWTSGTSAL